MRLLINVSVVTKNHRGMGMFTKKILLKLLEDKSFEFILVSCTDIDEILKNMIQKNNILYKQVNSPLPIFEQVILPFLINKYKPDICWFPSNTFPIFKMKKVKYVATIHDVIFLEKNIIPSSFYQKIGKFYRAFCITNGIKNIEILTSVSKTALTEIYDYFNIKNKIENKQVLYNSIDTDFNFDANIIEKLNLKNKKYIYTISGNAPHKNLPFLLESFYKFNKIYKDYKLVITGVSQQYHKLFDYNNVLFTDFLSEGEKNSLIKNADFFVFASLKEGFGIPLIESMCLNQNILASDIDVFKEIGKEYVNYFSPTDTNFLIKYLEDEKKIKNDLVEVRNFINHTFNIDTTVEKLKLILKGTT